MAGLAEELGFDPMAVPYQGGTQAPPMPKWIRALMGLGEGIGSAVMAPGKALRGEYDQLEIYPDGSVSPVDPRMIDDAATAAGLVSLGPAGLPAMEAGVLSMGLRQRYANALKAAAPGKDIDRIKLTPARMAVARDYMQKGPIFQDSFQKYWGAPYGSQVPAAPAHRQQAEAFARAAVKDGHKTRVKFPDGGSVYVRVGDEGTVRFADHAQPMDYVDGKYVPTGGYSSELGRRHHPASMSIDPRGGKSLDEALAWLKERQNTANSIGGLPTFQLPNSEQSMALTPEQVAQLYAGMFPMPQTAPNYAAGTINEGKDQSRLPQGHAGMSIAGYTPPPPQLPTPPMMPNRPAMLPTEGTAMAFAPPQQMTPAVSAIDNAAPMGRPTPPMLPGMVPGATAIPRAPAGSPTSVPSNGLVDGLGEIFGRTRIGNLIKTLSPDTFYGFGEMLKGRKG